MRLRLRLGALRKATARDHAVRFAFGGIVTACAGLVAHLFGPGV